MIKKEKQLTFFDFIKSIQKRKYIIDENNDKLYLKFIVNNTLAGNSELIDIINLLLNINTPNFSNKMHYDFLFYSGILNKKYYPYKLKVEKEDDLKILSLYYQEDIENIKDYLEILSVDEVEKIKNQMKMVMEFKENAELKL